MVESCSDLEAETGAAADEDTGVAVVAGTSGWPSALWVTMGDEACWAGLAMAPAKRAAKTMA